MKRFLKLLLLFLTPILLGIFSIEVMLRKIPNDYSYKNNFLNKHSDSIEFLFLGNSHVFFGINPKYINGNSFNAAYVSQSLNYDYAIIEKYATHWKNMKVIIIPIDYFSLYGSLEGSVEKWRIKNYNIYYGINNSKELSNNFEVFNGKVQGQLSRIYNYKKRHKDDLTCDSLGWGTSYKSSDAKNLQITGKEAALRHGKGSEHKKYFNQNVEGLKKIIQFTESENIKIIFITCPAYISYREHLNRLQLEETISTIQQLCRGNRNVTYCNFLYCKSFEAIDFYDADHLNEKGAKKFSLIMDSLINKN